MNWQREGTCAQPGVDPELHFPTTSDNGRLIAPSAIAQAFEAIRMCNGCPVLGRCREWGMTQSHGIWGGLTEQQRDAIRRGRTPQPLTFPAPAAKSAEPGRKHKKSVDELLTEIAASKPEPQVVAVGETRPTPPRVVTPITAEQPRAELGPEEWVDHYIATTADLFAKGA